MRILLIGGISSSLVNFRGPLIQDMLQKRVEVMACSGAPHRKSISELQSWGVRYYPIDLARAGLNPLTDFKLFIQLCRTIHQLKPDIVLAYTIKPIVYGILAARLCGVRAAYGMVEGLGRPFMPCESAGHFLSSLAAKSLYRFSLAFASKVFFLNPDDQQHFLTYRYVPKARAVLLNGIGIDLHAFTATESPCSPIQFLMVARLLRDKGVREYAAAARLIHSKLLSFSCSIAGALDENPTSITQTELDRWKESGAITHLGYLDDVRPAIKQSSVFVLPSYYREGVPRTLLEAMAMGRPIITTDAPGCRETVRGKRLQTPDQRLEPTDQSRETGSHDAAGMAATGGLGASSTGQQDRSGNVATTLPSPDYEMRGKLKIGANGILVPPRDAEALAEAMRFFIDNPGQIAIMGRESRRYAEDRYDVHKVNAVMLDAMGL